MMEEESSEKLRIEDILPELARKMMGHDPEDIESIKKLSKPLEKLCDKIRENKEKLNEAARMLIEDVGTLRIHAGSDLGLVTGFLENFSTQFSDALLDHVNSYQSLDRRFRLGVEIPLKKIRGDGLSVFSQIGASKEIRRLYISAGNNLERMVKEIPEILEKTTSGIIGVNKYLTARFTKPNKDQNGQEERTIRVQRDEDEDTPKYIKIHLVDDNPILTDFLLHVSDRVVPSQREKIEKTKKGKEKKIREVEKYRMESAIEEFVDLSTPSVIKTLKNPEETFSNAGKALESIYEVFQELIPKYGEVVDTFPELGIDYENEKLIEHNIKLFMVKTNRGIRKLSSPRLESIVQREEDYSPKNRIEADHFKIRDKLLTLLYSSMQDISKIKDYEGQEKKARETMQEAIKLKTEIEDITRSAHARRLLKNQRADNEYYEGRQGGIGRFSFERKPAPEVKLDEVIGKSFDRAKLHLADIIETGNYPHVMRLSAPGGKIRSNILLIGPYGCGKTEIAKAVCADERVIGASVSVTDTQTAYMHESVNNVRRVYDRAKELYLEGREKKPVALILDEFNGWFAKSGDGRMSDMDSQQIETTLLEILDGMRDYDGIITMAMTNKPSEIPKGIMRRFRYVDVVGQLTDQERSGMLKMFLEKTLPVSKKISQKHYNGWAEKLRDAPGDVVRKVVDETHFKLVTDYIKENPQDAGRVQQTLQKREIKHGYTENRDIHYLKDRIGKFRLITPKDIDDSINNLLKQPTIKMQIDTAKDVYEEAEEILNEIGESGATGFGMRRSRKHF